MAHESLNVAVVQLNSTEDIERNLKSIEALVTEASERGAEFVALPENAVWLRHQKGSPCPKEALDEGGPLLEWLKALAGRLNIWLLVGAFPETSEEPERFYNTSILLDGTAKGEGEPATMVSAYRKIHLFDIDVKDAESQSESLSIRPGQDPVLTAVRGIPTGLSICYDLRFPELYRHLAEKGALILTVPSAFTEFTGKDHWLPLLRARAIENQAFLVAPNQSGYHGGKRRTYGKSCIIDPWGTVLATAADGPGIAMAKLDFSYQARIRASLPALQHRRL